jgi:hypothetical protein
VGDRLKVITRYGEDEANTERRTVILMKVGGIEGRESHGIHWHVDPRIRIRYRGDPSRKRIDEIELTRADGTVATYLAGTPPKEESDTGSEWRTMDCVDCHNRPTHIYRMPIDEVDRALVEKRIDRTLPYIRREALKALEQPYGSHEEARAGIPKQIEAFYAKNYPDRMTSAVASVRSAGEVLADIYCSNVFPSMNIGWGTYASHVGHTNTLGCFRCHDEEHKTSDGKAIAQDCAQCHSLLAVDEENPAILGQLQP